MNLAKRMGNKEFFISIQIDPPLTSDVADFEDMLQKLFLSGARLVDINSSRNISHDSIQLAVFLKRFGFEVIPHVTTRDSSLNGLLNQIFAAYTWGGISNYLIIAGDPYDSSKAIFPSKGVFETDSSGVIGAVNEYLRNNKKFSLDVTIAAAVNQNETDIECEGELVEKKCKAGADFFMSQPIFSEDQAIALFNFYEKHSGGEPLMVGIWPLLHMKTIEAIFDRRIVGVELPKEIYDEAVTYYKDEDALKDWGLEEAFRLIKIVRRSRRANGVYIVAPARNPILLVQLIEKLRKEKLWN